MPPGAGVGFNPKEQGSGIADTRKSDILSPETVFKRLVPLN